MATVVTSPLELSQVTIVQERPPRAPLHQFAFAAMLLLSCGWVLSLPIFPTQDGAMHLYYIEVLRHIFHRDAGFAQHYLIRQPLPPYTLHYVLVFLLGSVVPALWAEKLMICLILVINATGFRFLAASIGKTADVTALWAAPLILSWPLFMGFQNYCLAVGLALWGWGLWNRARASKGLWRKLAFLLVVVSVTFTHPVPLLFLLLVIGIDIIGRLASGIRNRDEMILAVLAASTLGYIALFLDKSHVAIDAAYGPVAHGHLASLLLRWMTFATGGPWMALFRVVIAALLIGALAVSRRVFRTRWSNASTALACAVLLILTVPLLPDNMNGAEYFAQRLYFLIWLSSLAAASAAWPIAKRNRYSLLAGGLLFNFAVLGIGEHFIRPVAKELATLETMEIRHHKRGLLFDSPAMILNDRLTFNPYLRWSGAGYFRRSGAVLLNDPWTSPPSLLPVRRAPAALPMPLTPVEEIDPQTLHRTLLHSKEKRDRMMADSDLLVFVGKPFEGETVPDSLISLDTTHHWACHSGSWFSVCER